MVSVRYSFFPISLLIIRHKCQWALETFITLYKANASPEFSIAGAVSNRNKNSITFVLTIC